MEFTHLQTLSDPELGEALFSIHLGGIALDAADRLFAVGDNLVRVFDSAGEPLRKFELKRPPWSVFAERDMVWIGMVGQVALYTPAGEQVATLTDAPRLGRVTSIAVVGSNLFVADATHRAIRRYSREGEWLGDVGREVNTRGFMIPNGVLDLCVDSSTNTLLVAHPQKHRVERYNAGGQLVDKWGRFGMHDPADFGGCCNPTNLAAGVDGMIAVSEKAPPRIKLYDAVGSYVSTLPGGVFDPNTKNLDLAIDSRGTLYATDPLRRTIEVFAMVAQEEPVP